MPEFEFENFGRNVCAKPDSYCEPKTSTELLELLGKHRDQSIRVIASGHAWSDGIVTDGMLVNLKNFQNVDVNLDNLTVRVGAGCRVKQLVEQLGKHGLTLPSVGLIDEQTVAGATATGTHGSGKQCLSHFIRRVWIAHFDPATDEPTITEIASGPDLQAAKCSLGLLGAVVELEFECRSVYQVQEYAAKHKTLAEVLDAEKNYPLQQFFLMPWSWHWFGQHRKETKQTRSWAAGLYRIYWHLGIDWGLHLVVLLFAKILRARWMVSAFYRLLLPLVFARNWKVVDDSHAMLTMEHELFRHIEIELFVKRPELGPALEHVKNTIIGFGGSKQETNSDSNFLSELKGQYFHHYPVCVRRVLVDDTLISMSSAIGENDVQDWYAVSLICYDWPQRRDGFFAFANYLATSMEAQFGARCHWGKYNPLERESVESQYPNIDAFGEAVQRFDCRGRFANDWLRRTVLKKPNGNPNE
jgi:hypothetical protein